MSRIGWAWCLGMTLVLQGTAVRVSAREPAVQPLEEVPGGGAEGEYDVCPPPCAAPVFVTAEELLRRADTLLPPTAEGWIITNRCVPACGVLPLDPVFEDAGYSLRLRQFDAEIRLLKSQIAALEERELVYRYFNKTGVLLVTYQQNQLAKQAAEERLRILRHERMLYLRNRQRARQLATQGVVVSREMAAAP